MRVGMFSVAVSALCSGVAMADSVQYYGGDFDGFNSLLDVKAPRLGEHWVFDDFQWGGGTVTRIFGNYIANDLTISGMEFEIRSGMSSGNGGTLVASGGGSSSWVATGTWNGYSLVQGTLDVTDFNLAAGSYFLAIRPIIVGYWSAAYLCASGGANGVGSSGNGDNFWHTPIPGYYYQANVNGSQNFSQGIYGVELVPLPPAALAGGATLAGLAGFRVVRRRATKA